jgi:hypothetical protein
VFVSMDYCRKERISSVHELTGAESISANTRNRAEESRVSPQRSNLT